MMHLVPNLHAAAVTLLQEAPQNSLFFPPKASNFAAEADWLYNFIFWVSLVAFVLTVGVAALFTIQYRKSKCPEPQPSPSHSTKLEVIWSVIPSIFLVIFFWKGFELFVDYRTVPAGAYQIQVRGKKWDWTFTYPNGAVTTKLLLPKDEPVKLLISADDVLHSVFIPAFRVKQDAVPGRYTQLWFEATMAGTFPFYCTEYCGTNHSGMKTEAIVYATRAEFDKEVEDALQIYDENASPVENGLAAYTAYGCASCHSTDGSVVAAPSFKGLFGSTRSFADGSSAVADENYILESITQPKVKVVEGYQALMAPNNGFDLDDQDRAYLVEYIKSIAN